MSRIAAIVREVPNAIADCELSFVERSPIDLALARRQHAAYVAALETAGCEVRVAPPLPAMADAVFVEDTTVVVDELAVLTRPGAESRRGEVASMADTLRPLRPLAWIEAPGTIDGGDVLRIGRRVYVGRSARSNDSGLEQLRALLAPHSYSVEGVRTRECLHLKSAITAVAGDTVLVNPQWLVDDPFGQYRRIEIDPGEEHAANALRAGDVVLYPAAFPRTEERLRVAGIDVRLLDLSELQKAEGATTCCSVLLAIPGAA
ncbi:MAG: dimethylargininase [Thermomonas sp.]